MFHKAPCLTTREKALAAFVRASLLIVIGFAAPFPVFADTPVRETEVSKLQIEEGRQSVVEDLDAFFNEVPEFSGVVLIADRGEPIYKRAFGTRNYSTNAQMQDDSLFELASVSKPFTSMAVLMLVQEGLIDLDDPLEEYISGLEYEGVTIRHLLTHTSGVPDYMAVMSEHWDKTKVATNADAIAYLKQYRPEILFAPGEKYKYSNTGYLLLASIVEAVTDQDFADFLRQRIFEPLEMTDTDIREYTEWDTNDRFAVGSKKNEETGKHARAVDTSGETYAVWLGGRYGPGRVSSTVDDLLKWDRSLYTEKLVSRDLLAAAFTKPVLNDGEPSDYGFGWSIDEENAGLGKIVSHTGGNPGISTVLLRCIETDMTAIVLNNTGDFDTVRSLRGKLEGGLLSRLRPGEMTQLSK
ncbi:MAG: serine hydrolase domain-containing protein [Pseudomonadota bacterium]